MVASLCIISDADIFIPLEKLRFNKVDLIRHKGKVETGLILFKNEEVSGKMTVSLNYPDKGMEMIIYGDKLVVKTKSCFFDEKNNLNLAINNFFDTLNGKKGNNLERSIMVTKILDRLSPFKP